jgi:LacI family transcriptional regulator
MATNSNAPAHGHGSGWWLAQQIQERIANGVYSSGAKLPSYRELMKEFSLTSGTVSYAMSILAGRGIVIRRHGSGVYVRAAYGQPTAGATQQGLFALVVPEIESGLYLSLQAGIAEAAAANREQLITMTTNGRTTQQADVMLQLIDRGVAGIALVPCYEPSHAYQLRHLHRSGVPLVLLHRGVAGVRAPSVRIPFAEIGATAGAEIGSLGHRRVAALVGPASDTTTAYLDGLQRGLDRHRASIATEFVLRTETMLISAADYARYGPAVDRFLDDLIARSHRPTAVFATFDRLAEVLYALASKKGIRVPEDLSIVSFGGNRRAGHILSSLATVAVDEHQAGKQAHELLASMQRGELPLASDQTIMMPVSFDAAATLAPPPSMTTVAKRK